MGLKAHRSRSGARRRQIFRRMARHASEQSARDRAAIGDAGLSVPVADRSRLRHVADHLRINRAVGVPYSDDQIANAVADLKAQADPDNAGADAFTKRYPEGGCAQFRRQVGRRPRWTRWSRTCRCSAPWSTSSSTTKSKSSLKGRTMKALSTICRISSRPVWTPIFVGIFSPS